MNIKKISKTHQLTKTESIILEYISKGFTTREIADSLSVSPKTIETHRANCIKKLNIRDKKRNALLHFILRTKING